MTHFFHRNSVRYHLMNKSKLIRVCKVFFLNTLDISEKKVRAALDKADCSITGALSRDRRGKHTPANKLPEAVHDCITAQIMSLSIVPAHWCRRDSTKRYVEGNWNETSAYNLYVHYAEEQGLKAVSKPVYTAALKRLNIGFHQPRKDRCWCADFCNLTAEEQIERQEDYDIHMRRTEAMVEEKKRDKRELKKDSTTMMAFFDLEAILYAPLKYAKPLYYKRKIASHNLTVYNSKTKQGLSSYLYIIDLKIVLMENIYLIINYTGYCYLWHEFNGRKGSQEIVSCLAKFITEEVPNGIKRLILYADNCAGNLWP